LQASILQHSFYTPAQKEMSHAYQRIADGSHGLVTENGEEMEDEALLFS
jgi:hypothetical protein